MTLSSVPLRRLLAPLLVALSAPGLAASDQRFTTPDTLSTEAQTLVTLLEQAHYNRDAVHSGDYAQVIPDYMKALDGQHLFFLDTDRADFVNRFGKNVYYNVDYLGKIDAAYDIFYVYDDRVTARIGWIFGELKKNFDFTSQRHLQARPLQVAVAHDGRRGRRALAEAPEVRGARRAPEQEDPRRGATKIVRKRYERMLKNVGETDGSDLAETFLTYDRRALRPPLHLLLGRHLRGLRHPDEAEAGRHRRHARPRGRHLHRQGDRPRRARPTSATSSSPTTRSSPWPRTSEEPVEIIGMKLRKIVDHDPRRQGHRASACIVQPGDATDSSVRKEIVITRDVVKLDSARARAAVFQVPGADGKTVPLGVITLPAFYGPAEDGDTDAATRPARASDVAKLIVQLKEANVQGIVLDLRHNGGGYLSEAIELAGLFIHKGPVVQVQGLRRARSRWTTTRPRTSPTTARWRSWSTASAPPPRRSSPAPSRTTAAPS